MATPGLISTNINTQDPVKSLQGFEAERITVDDADTVQGQLNKIIAADSPLMTQAKTTAKQGMNQRGLLNTSMAVGAGQDAVIGRALPIASQDASTYFTAKRANQQAGNTALQYTAGAQNTGSLAVLEQQNREKTIAAQTAGEKDIIGAQTDASLTLNADKQKNLLEAMDVEQTNLLAKMDQGQRHDLEKTFVASSQDALATLQEQVAIINTTEGLTAAQQAAAVKQVYDVASSNIKFLGVLSTTAPDWDPMFAPIPGFKATVSGDIASVTGGGTGTPAPAAPAASPQNNQYGWDGTGRDPNDVP